MRPYRDWPMESKIPMDTPETASLVHEPAANLCGLPSLLAGQLIHRAPFCCPCDANGSQSSFARQGFLSSHACVVCASPGSCLLNLGG